MKAVARFLFYFLIILFLLIAIVTLIIGTVFIANTEFRELTGIDVVRTIVKRIRRKNEQSHSDRQYHQGSGD